jgi:hypothetical protein
MFDGAAHRTPSSIPSKPKPQSPRATTVPAVD